MRNKTYINKVKNEVEKWENTGPGYLSQISDFVFYPAQKAAELLIPDFVMDAVEASVRGCLEALMFSASYTISKDEVLKSLVNENSDLISLETVKNSDDFETMDKVAANYWNWNLGYAITQGMATGAAGLPGLAANIPALFTIIFRMLQQISLSYGYDPEKLEEKHFIISILSVASSADVKAKQAAMIYLKQVQVQLAKKTWKKLAEEKAVMVAIRQFAKTIGIQITKRKALQMVPIIGGIIGGSFDGVYCNDVGRAAVMAFRKRKLSELNLE